MLMMMLTEMMMVVVVALMIPRNEKQKFILLTKTVYLFSRILCVFK